jgi:maltose alpha-D-glucosyltransferase/alpha-amylase
MLGVEAAMNVLPDITVAPQPVIDDWYKDAIIYQLHVKAFADSNDDGIGDFKGLTQRLDYLQDLGVTALWLLPFYPSPGRDDGYDIADYRRINSDFGTMNDFRRFMVEAKARNLKIITELVINHTSDQHPWFRRARRSPPGSNARGWYVWSDTDQRYLGTRVIFTDTEKSNWAWDPDAGAYYWHRFFSHQPDLNYASPQVFAAIVQVMRRWLDYGVDGFRLDAIPYLCEREGTTSENLPETHNVIKRLRAELEAYAPGTVLLAEANQWPEDVSAYFGDGDECHMAYHFPLMPRIYMAIGQEDRFPITDILRQTPDIPANCQWALFLRNHDELTLEMVTDVERDYLWSTYAADPRARLNLGIRRRLAPLMDNDRRKIELMNSLLLSLPGTPIIYYGDELGMGDNIYLGDRNGVRTPMQWTPDRNGGFSRCDPARLYLPPIMDAVYGYQAVNVEAQSRSLSSLLSWTKRMIAVRKTSQVFGRGTLTFIRPSNRAVIAYVREFNGEVMLCVANLSRSAQAAELDLSAWNGRVPEEMVGRTHFRQITEQLYVVTLAPYGFFWLRLREPSERGSADTITHVPEWITLVFSDGWKSLGQGRTRQVFENDVLPPFLASRRWFSNKDSNRIGARLHTVIPLDGAQGSIIAIVEVAAGNDRARYALPLMVQWARLDRNFESAKTAVVAPVRRANHEGILIDAVGEQGLVGPIVRLIHDNKALTSDGLEIVFRSSHRFANAPLGPIENLRAVSAEQSNSTVMVDSAYVLKFYRRVSADPCVEFEMGRFLTDVAQFSNSPALLGTVELIENDAQIPLAIMHEYVENQGDAWTFTGAYLDRALDEERVLTAVPEPADDKHAAFFNRIKQIGRRVGELHAALASRPDIASFAPEAITGDDIREWTEALVANASQVLDRLAQGRNRLNETAYGAIDELVAKREMALDRIRDLLPATIDAEKIRHHGDLHLGQILMVKDDAFIIDFEGEPHRAASDRVRKAPSARDAAGVIRSLDYAATAALHRIVKVPPEELAKLDAYLDEWRAKSAAAFYAGMRETLREGRLWPQDEETARRLLRFFVAEKAIYEIGYELANRPDWIAVPVEGARRVLLGGDGNEQ